MLRVLVFAFSIWIWGAHFYQVEARQGENHKDGITQNSWNLEPPLYEAYHNITQNDNEVLEQFKRFIVSLHSAVASPGIKTLTKREREFLSHAFKSIPTDGSILGDMLRYDEEDIEITIDDIISSTVSLDSLQKVKDLIENNMMKTGHVEKGDIDDIDSPYEARSDDTDQLGGYIGCKRDYDSLAEPVTIPLQKILMNIIGIPGGDLIPPRPAQPFGRPMLGALGKIPAGITMGNLHWIGAYDMCEEVQANYNYTEITNGTDPWEPRKFNGQYCRIDLQPDWEIFGNLSLPPLLRIQVGICVPDTCTTNDVVKYVTSAEEGNVVISVLLNNALSVKVTDIYCGIDEQAAAGDEAFTAAKVFFYILLTTVLAATVYDLFIRKRLKILDESTIITKNISGIRPKLSHQSSTSSTMELVQMDEQDMDTQDNDKPSPGDRLELLFVSFSAYSNMMRIMNTEVGNQNLRVLDGIRALSFIYAVFGATALFGPLINEVLLTSNVVNAVLTLPSDLWFQAVINYNFSSEAFFVISGFLITYKWLLHFEKKDTHIDVKTMVYFYVHRYWRLVCSLMIVIAFYTSSVYYIGGGPNFPRQRRDVENCKENWWTNLLMVNNLVNTDSQCMGPQWYLSALFQLHIITPIVLIPLVRRPLFGYIILGSLMVIHLIVATVISDDLYGSKLRYIPDFYTSFFLTPWCRAGPYFTGIATAILIVKRKQGIKIHSIVAFLIWCCALMVLIAAIFSTYTQLKDFPPQIHRWSRTVAVAYDVLARNGFGMAIAWIIIATQWGCAGFVGDFLCWSFWHPLSKLVYPSFLTYVLVCYGQAYSTKFMLYGSVINLFYMAFANAWLVYFFGLFVVSLLVHYPICLGIEKSVLVSSKQDCIKAGCHTVIHLTVPDKPQKQQRTSFVEQNRYVSSQAVSTVTNSQAVSEVTSRVDSIYDNADEIVASSSNGNAGIKNVKRPDGDTDPYLHLVSGPLTESMLATNVTGGRYTDLVTKATDQGLYDDVGPSADVTIHDNKGTEPVYDDNVITKDRSNTYDDVVVASF